MITINTLGYRQFNAEEQLTRFTSECLEADVPYFFKQVGGRYRNSGGRLLDGREWNETPPEVPATRERSSYATTN